MADGVGIAGLQGAAGGVAKGAQLGTMINPGLGTLIGAGAGALMGGIGGASKKKKAVNASEISPVDPNEQARMVELNQAIKNINVGADALTQNRLQELSKIGAQTQGAISKVSGGDVGSTVQGMLQAQRNTQAGANAALADRGQLPYFMNLAQQLGTRMSQRKVELDKWKADMALAESAQNITDANVNKNAYLSTLGQGDMQSVGNFLSGLNMPNFTNQQSAAGLSGGELGVVSPQVMQNIANIGAGVLPK
jgi:hypothetical protein